MGKLTFEDQAKALSEIELPIDAISSDISDPYVQKEIVKALNANGFFIVML